MIADASEWADIARPIPLLAISDRVNWLDAVPEGLKIPGHRLRERKELTQQFLGAVEVHFQASRPEAQPRGNAKALPRRAHWNNRNPYGGRDPLAPCRVQFLFKPAAPRLLEGKCFTSEHDFQAADQFLPVHEKRLRRLEAAKAMEQLEGSATSHTEHLLDSRSVNNRGLCLPQFLHDLG